MGTRSRIAIPSTGGRFKSIYCHWEGDTTGVGKVLTEHYASSARAKALIKVGDISTLRDSRRLRWMSSGVIAALAREYCTSRQSIMRVRGRLLQA